VDFHPNIIARFVKFWPFEWDSKPYVQLEYYGCYGGEFYIFEFSMNDPVCCSGFSGVSQLVLLWQSLG
jgi:hypothetical protein